MSITNTHTDTLTVSETEPAVDTDANGDAVVTVGQLRTIESPADVTASSPDGYVANVQSVSGNSVTVRIFQETGAAGTLDPVTDTADVTDVHLRAEGY